MWGVRWALLGVAFGVFFFLLCLLFSSFVSLYLLPCRRRFRCRCRVSAAGGPSTLLLLGSFSALGCAAEGDGACCLSIPPAVTKGAQKAPKIK